MILQPFPANVCFMYRSFAIFSEIQKFYKNKQEKYNQHQRDDYLKKYGIIISFLIHISSLLILFFQMIKCVSQFSDGVFPGMGKGKIPASFHFSGRSPARIFQDFADIQHIFFFGRAQESIFAEHLHRFGSSRQHRFTGCQVFINFSRIVTDGQRIQRPADSDKW